MALAKRRTFTVHPPPGVATRELEKKLRLIYDGHYINLWTKYENCKFEGLMDVLGYAKKGGWATVSDYKAGYHHLSCPSNTIAIHGSML